VNAPGGWATFDCYGTLVDWNGGVRTQLERVLGGDGARLLERYHEHEPRIQAERPGESYREVMARTLERVAADEGKEIDEEERDALGRSLPGWDVFPEVPGALSELRDRGWRLVILSNTDRDFIEASMEAIGVPFDLAIVASEIGSYKPAHRHWKAFFERTGADRAAHVHVAASLFHDIAPARELSLTCVWINRLGESPDPEPDAELPDLAGLPQVLDSMPSSRRSSPMPEDPD
jgi:2-haloacid dehalogenase